MAFDEAKFRKLAAENGYSEEEITAHLSSMTNKATGQEFGAASEKSTQSAAQDLANKGAPIPGTTPAVDSRTTLEKTFDFAASPIGTASIGLLGIGGAAAIKKGLESRRIGQSSIPERQEPVLITNKEIQQVAKPVDYNVPAYQRNQPAPAAQPAPVAPEAAPSLDKLEQAKARLMQGQSAGIGVQPPAPVVAQPAPVVTPPAQPATPTVTEAVEAGVSPSKALQMDVAKQLDETPVEGSIKKRAAKTQISFKTPEQLPKDLSFRADLGPGDNWLYNTYGPEGRKAILEQFNEGKPAVSYERAKELSQAVQGKRVGPAIPRDVAKERGIAPPETNYGKLGKAVKVAGAAGLALTAAQAAQAAQQAQQGDYSAARELGFNMLGMIPGLAAAFNLGTYSPELGAGEQKELAQRRRKPATID